MITDAATTGPDAGIPSIDVSSTMAGPTASPQRNP